MENEMLAEVLGHAEWIMFALVLANQAGVPVFAAPALLAVGALAWTGDVNVGVAVAGAMGASLCADLGWYTVGRWRGHWALAALERLSRGTRALVDDAQRLFLAHDRAFQLGARFLPELNPVAAAFAGVAGVGPRRFVLGAAVSAAIWTSTWIGVGYLIASTTWSGGGSGILVFSVIVAASAIASLTVLIRPAVRAFTVVVRSLRARTSARPRATRLPAEHPVGSRRSPC
jgi:membrane protein DedA with SNARE-associated domain